MDKLQTVHATINVRLERKIFPISELLKDMSLIFQRDLKRGIFVLLSAIYAADE